MHAKGASKDFEIIDLMLRYGEKFILCKNAVELPFQNQLTEEAKLTFSEPIEVLKNKFTLVADGKLDPEYNNDIFFTPGMFVHPVAMKDTDKSSFRYWL